MSDSSEELDPADIKVIPSSGEGDNKRLPDYLKGSIISTGDIDPSLLDINSELPTEENLDDKIKQGIMERELAELKKQQAL
jgi:hypothetical protein